jgi:hypothetical protein
MFDQPITILDRISTLELSKIWLSKALENLEAELEANGRDLEADSESEDQQ